MQSWQIKVLKEEESVLNDLNGFVHGHAVYVLLGIIGLLAISLAWVLSGRVRQRFPQQAGSVRSAIVIESPAPPPPEPDDWNPFPPAPYWRERDCDPDEWDD